jgi:signal transduction histidine kinase
MRFTHLSPAGRRLAATVVAGVVMVIGTADYLAGTRISFVSFYLFPVAAAVVCLGPAAGVAIAAASVVVRFLGDVSWESTRTTDTWLWWNSIGSLVVYLAVVVILDALVRLYRQTEDKVEARTVELEVETRRREQLQRELVELSSSERSAIGRELHDQLGQHLVGTALAAQVLAHRLAARDEQAAREARKIADLLEQGVAQTRQVAHGLVLTRIDPPRLRSELEELCAVLRQQHPGVRCVACLDPAAEPPDAETAAQLFRIGQEALRNALRHAGAAAVELVLRTEDGDLVLSVTDDGRGLPPPDGRGNGLGLAILRHRAEVLGAQLAFEVPPGGGTRVVCRLERRNFGLARAIGPGSRPPFAAVR